MARDFRWQAAKSGSNQIGGTDHRQQGSGDFRFRMPRTGNKALREERDEEQQRQCHAAEPPSDGRPSGSRGRVLRKLKEENAGSREHGAGEEIAAAENQRDAILGALKTDKSQRGEN